MPNLSPSRAMVGLLAASCGIIVANIYYSQPLTGLIGPAVGLNVHASSLIVSLTQLGYAAGLLFLVPLGDIVENRKLMVCTIATSVPALLLMGLAHHGAMLLLAAVLIGLTSVAVQMLVPLAAHLTPPARRGQVVGTVTSGLLLGILLSRPVASMIAAQFSWRMVFFLSAALMIVMTIVLRLALPRRQPLGEQHYGALLASLFTLPLNYTVLRQRATYQAAAFAGFSLFWTGVPLYLSQHFGFTQRGIALFALVGAAGALSAPLAGRLADRGYSHIGTIGALCTIIASFALAWLGAKLNSVVLLALAGVALDAAVQCNLVIGQRAIYLLDAEIRSRLNGMFMSIFFAGGAAASAVTSTLLIYGGWSGLCAAGAILALAALAYFLTARR